MSNVISAKAPSTGSCEKIRIKTSDGRVFNLGRPNSIFFGPRLWFYKWQRRKEMNHG